MIGYIARDKDNQLYLYSDLPEYDEDLEIWFGAEYITTVTLFEDITKQFEDLSYSDEPIKVEIKLEKV